LVLFSIPDGRAKSLNAPKQSLTWLYRLIDLQVKLYNKKRRTWKNPISNAHVFYFPLSGLHLYFISFPNPLYILTLPLQNLSFSMPVSLFLILLSQITSRGDITLFHI
jgi:hypothetical protein